MTHTITEDGLAEYVEKQREAWTPYAFNNSGGSSFKKLEFRIGQVAPIYRVTAGGREIYIGALKETAIREYNSLP